MSKNDNINDSPNKLLAAMSNREIGELQEKYKLTPSKLTPMEIRILIAHSRKKLLDLERRGILITGDSSSAMAGKINK
jgi:hypothetical protein